MAGSGIAHIASLWFRDLDERAVAALLLGAVYLIIAIGLFGQSRFTLFMAIIVPGSVALTSLPDIQLQQLIPATSIAIDLLVAALSLTVLWQVRNRPSQ
jgi:hypothetical protein